MALRASALNVSWIGHLDVSYLPLFGIFMYLFIRHCLFYLCMCEEFISFDLRFSVCLFYFVCKPPRVPSTKQAVYKLDK